MGVVSGGRRASEEVLLEGSQQAVQLQQQHCERMLLPVTGAWKDNSCAAVLAGAGGEHQGVVW